MPDPIAMVIEHVRLNHRRVECGPGVPGCGPDCEGGPDGEVTVFCSTCGAWPCAVSILLGELDRLRKVVDEVQEEMLPHDIGWVKLRAAIGLGPEL